MVLWNFGNFHKYLAKSFHSVDSGSGLHAPLGKASFSSEKILLNLKAFMEAVSEKKPEKIKGKYILAAFLSTTMGPSFRIDPQSLDPKDKSYALVGL